MSINTLTINGHKATITFDPDIELFRGEFLGLSGGADFYAKDIKGLKKEGAISLKVYLDECKAKGREPYKKFSGRFNLRISPELHERLIEKAKSQEKSLNVWAAEALDKAVELSD